MASGPDNRLVVAAALLPEVLALRAGLAGATVVHAGLRARYAYRVAEVARSGHGRMVVAGLAGALVAGMRPGDVVVADEVRGSAGGPRRTASAQLAAGLRAGGRAVHVGPVVQSARTATGEKRAEFAANGAIAVDMESAELLRAWGAGSAVVVRIIVDTPRRELWHPATVRAGIAALRELRTIGPVLESWAASDEQVDPVSSKEVRRI